MDTLILKKSEVATKLKALCQMIELQFEERVQIFRTNNAKDFCNHKLISYFTELGIIHESLCIYTPQQNGVAEQKIGLVQEKGHVLLLQSGAPIYLWGEAMLTATFLINWTPTEVFFLNRGGRAPRDNAPPMSLK